MLVKRAEILTYMRKTTSITEAESMVLDLIHPMVERAVDAYLNKRVSRSFHVEYLPIGMPVAERDFVEEPINTGHGTVEIDQRRTGNERLQLTHTPVLLSGLEIREDTTGYGGQAANSFGDNTVLNVGTDFFLDIQDGANQISSSGIVYRIGRWPTVPRSIKASYYGGASAAQLADELADIKLGFLIAITENFRQAIAKFDSMRPVISESIGKYSYSTSGGFADMLLAGGVTIPDEVKRLLFRYRNLGNLFG